MAERYTKKRYIQDIGKSFGPVVTDKRNLITGQSNLSESIRVSIDTMKQFAIAEAKDEAQERAARKSLMSDPQEIIANTQDGFLTLEDELSRKYAFINLKNKILDEVSQKSIDIENDAINNDLDSTTFQTNLKLLLDSKLKNLRENGLDSPTFELEIKENLAGSIRQKVNKYATNRIVNKQKLHKQATIKTITYAAKNYGLFNTDVDRENFNNVLTENKEFIDSTSGLQKLIDDTVQEATAERFNNTAKLFVNSRPSIKQLADFEKEFNKYKTTLKDILPPSVNRNIRETEQVIGIYRGNNIIASEEIANSRNTLSLSAERNQDEESLYSPNARAAYNIIDTLVYQGNDDISEDKLNDLVSLVTDIATGPVNLDDGNAYKQNFRNYFIRRKEAFEKDEAGFLARETGQPLQMIFNGVINKDILNSRLQSGYSVITQEDADSFSTDLNNAKPEGMADFIDNFFKTGANYENILYRDLMMKLDPKDRMKVRSFVIARDADKLDTGNNKLLLNVFGGIEYNITTKEDGDTQTARNTLYDDALEQVLPPDVFTSVRKPAFKKALKDTLDLYFKGSFGSSIPTEEDVLEIAKIFVGDITTDKGQIMGFVMDGAAKSYYLDFRKRPLLNAATADSINDFVDFVDNSTLGLYQFELQQVGNELKFVNNGTQPTGNKIEILDVFTASNTPDAIKLTANKLRDNFVFRNAEPMDFGVKTLNIDVSDYAVAQDENGDILRYENNSPILYDIKRGAHEFSVLNILKTTKDETDLAFTIRGVKATGIKNIRGPVTRTLDEIKRSDRDRIIRLRRTQSDIY